jgi:hypothetical protein
MPVIPVVQETVVGGTQSKAGRGKRHESQPKKTKLKQAGLWWLTPIMLATQEAEMRRIRVQSQHRQIVCETQLVEWLMW